MTVSPISNSPYAALPAQSQQAPATQVATAAAPAQPQYVAAGQPAAPQGPPAWNAQWQQTFTQLGLAPDEVQFLSTSGFDQRTLSAIADELASSPAQGPAGQTGPVGSASGAGRPTPGYDAGSATSDPMPVGGPVRRREAGAAAGSGSPSAWSPQWEQKFTTLLQKAGMAPAQIDDQLSQMRSAPVDGAQLQQAYTGMVQAVGAFDPSWKDKFGKLLDQMKVPAEQRDQQLQALATSGMSTEQLQKTYDEAAAQLPAWGPEWENKFRSLEAPGDLIKQLKESGAPKEALEKQFQSMLDAKMKFKNDGRLQKLLDAGATPEEKWNVILADVKGEDFDKIVDQTHDSHVPIWKRLLSFGVNLIPGAYALQYITGQDWVTGSKIDRTNPLNILGAVGSGFAGFTAVRGIINGVQGLSAANSAVQAANGAKLAGAAASIEQNVTAAAGLGKISTGAVDAIKGAGMLEKLAKPLSIWDYAKSATPIINRFGEANKLATVGRGYYQGMQLASGAAALTSKVDAAGKIVEGGGYTVDKGIKSTVLAQLKQGKSIDEALAGVQRGDGALRSTEVARLFNNNGYLQNATGFSMNPWKRASVSVGETGANGARVNELSRGVNFGTRGGLAQGLGANRAGNLQAAEQVALAKNLPFDAASAYTKAGLSPATVERVGLQGAATAHYGQRLDATGRLGRAFAQLGGSNRAVGQVMRQVEHGGNKVYAAASRFAQVPSNSKIIVPGLTAGVIGGSMGAMVQPAWNDIKADPGYLVGNSKYDAEQKQIQADAAREQAELDRLYSEQQATGAAVDASAGAGAVSGGGQAAPQAAAPAPAGPTAPTAPAGSSSAPVTVDPTTGFLIDQQTGLMADPNTGDVIDPRTGQVVGSIANMLQGGPSAPAGQAQPQGQPMQPVG